ncbi:MAG: hypothetical protein V4696_12760 [Pseudomonadota bacterium]
MTAPVDIRQLDFLPLITPALGRVLQVRLRQIEQHGHTAAADDDAGLQQLIRVSRSKILKTLQTAFRDIDGNLQMAVDQAMARIDAISTAELDLLDRRLAQAIATGLAAMDVIDRERAGR